VLPEFFKDDGASQWKGGKFDLRSPQTPEPMVTKIGVSDKV